MAKKKKKKKGNVHFHQFHNKDRGQHSFSIKDDAGNVLHREVLLPNEIGDFLAQFGRTFKLMYGVEPPAEMTLAEMAEKIGQPLPSPQEQVDEVIKAMRTAGVREEIIYAFRKTNGLLVTESNQHLINDSDLAAWNDAIDEYFSLKEQNMQSSNNARYPDIRGTRESFHAECVDNEIMLKIQETMNLNLGWQDGNCPMKSGDDAALGSLTRMYYALISEANRAEEALVWQEIIELAFIRIGTLIAERSIRLVHHDLEGDPDSDDEFSPEQWVFRSDDPDSDWLATDEKE
ncbi:MAG: hypothetical protein LLF76_03710 [Planctomycetaceae bacterium]|nr:hypothetical protein [Planctomycetaceae bacterium]